MGTMELVIIHVFPRSFTDIITPRQSRDGHGLFLPSLSVFMCLSSPLSIYRLFLSSLRVFRGCLGFDYLSACRFFYVQIKWVRFSALVRCREYCQDNSKRLSEKITYTRTLLSHKNTAKPRPEGWKHIGTRRRRIMQHMGLGGVRIINHILDLGRSRSGLL